MQQCYFKGVVIKVASRIIYSMGSIRDNFGKNVRKYRKLRSITQEDLSFEAGSLSYIDTHYCPGVSLELAGRIPLGIFFPWVDGVGIDLLF